MKKPLILLISSPPNKEAEASFIPLNCYYVYQYYIDALRAAGAAAVIMPPGSSRAEMSSVFGCIDGLLFTGGGDLDPALYEGSFDDENRIYGVDKHRDYTEIELLKLALATKKPILGICRGMQLINVLLGGNLFEDVGARDESNVRHRESQVQGVYHDVILNGKGRILNEIGDQKGSKISTVSWHHQAINKLAKDLVVVAEDEDGMIEAIEKPDHPWLLGVQWHPELSYDKDETQFKIFQLFVDACLDNQYDKHKL